MIDFMLFFHLDQFKDNVLLSYSGIFDGSYVCRRTALGPLTLSLMVRWTGPSRAGASPLRMRLCHRATSSQLRSPFGDERLLWRPQLLAGSSSRASRGRRWAGPPPYYFGRLENQTFWKGFLLKGWMETGPRSEGSGLHLPF